MPIYEYSCAKCGKVVDVLQKMDDPPPKKCEACGARGKLARVVSRTSFVLKGGGWYSDLYGSKKKDSTSAASSAESKPASKAESSSSSKAPAAGSSSSSAKAETPAPAKASSESK